MNTLLQHRLEILGHSKLGIRLALDLLECDALGQLCQG